MTDCRSIGVLMPGCHTDIAATFFIERQSCYELAIHMVVGDHVGCFYESFSGANSIACSI